MSEIEGVHVERLKLVRNERGHLLEVCSEIDPDAPRFAQVYVTFTRGGIVKAWYRHHHQIDQIALLSGRLELVLYDDRADSGACSASSSTSRSRRSSASPPWCGTASAPSVRRAPT